MTQSSWAGSGCRDSHYSTKPRDGLQSRLRLGIGRSEIRFRRGRGLQSGSLVRKGLLHGRQDRTNDRRLLRWFCSY